MGVGSMTKASHPVTYVDTWTIEDAIITLTNNSNLIASSIILKDINDATLETYTDVQPWQNVEIVADSTSATIVYPDKTLILPVSTAQSSSVFTHQILNNNYGESVYVDFYGIVNNIVGVKINTTSFLIEAGDSIPFITGTTSASVISNTDITLIAQRPVDDNSYEITSFPILRKLTSDVAILRLLGGQTPIIPSLPAARLYGFNPLLFAEFLYVDTYAEIILDPVAQADAISAVNTILLAYGEGYILQPNFNYLSYLYLIYAELDEAEVTLLADYPGSDPEIRQFFVYIKDHADNLLS